MASRGQDRSFRSLAGLEKTASTSRVLNLAAIASQNAGDGDYHGSPFFKATALNGAVIIKHRLRQDEQYNFDAAKRISTKLIIPFERTDLSLGGRSLFVGQRGWHEMLMQLRGDQDEEARDISLLEALDELPSLDPFLLREHLKRRDFKIANCYFAISAADTERMQRFVSGEISKLVDLAYGGPGAASDSNNNIAKLVSLLLSGEVRSRAVQSSTTTDGATSLKVGAACRPVRAPSSWLSSSTRSGLSSLTSSIPASAVTALPTSSRSDSVDSRISMTARMVASSSTSTTRCGAVTPAPGPET